MTFLPVHLVAAPVMATAMHRMSVFVNLDGKGMIVWTAFLTQDVTMVPVTNPGSATAILDTKEPSAI